MKVDMLCEKFGKLKVLGEVHWDRKGKRQWLCQCDCGKGVIVRQESLRSGHTKSCGCLSRECTRQRRTTHGHRVKRKTTREYSVWQGMKQRCLYSKNKAY